MGYLYTISAAGSMLLASVLVTASLQANPFTMSYGGRLATESGQGVVGPVKLEVKFYNVASGGAAIGVSPVVKNNVALSDGVFQIDLQPELTMPEYNLVLSSTASTWIEITDLTNGKVYPRQRLTAVPFAMKVPVDGTTVKFVDGKLVAPSNIPTGGSNGQYLQTDGSGNFAWSSPSVAAGAITANSITNTEIASSAAIATTKLSGPLTSITGHGLGTAAALNVGTGNNNVVQLDGTGKLPAVDGSALTNISASTITSQGALAVLSAVGGGLTGTITDDTITDVDIKSDAAIATTKLSGAVTSITGHGLGTSASLNVGTGINNVVQLDGTSKLPAVDGSQLTSLSGGSISSGTVNNDRINWAAPGNIGSATPGTGSFTTLYTGNNGVKIKDNDGTVHYLILKAPDNMAASQEYMFPAAPEAGKFLTTDIMGNLSWAVPSGAGDMLRSVYDTNSNNIVDLAQAFSGQGALATLGAVSGGTAGTITDDSITDADIKSDAAIATSKLSGAVTSITGHGLGALAAVAAVSGGTGGTITDNTITNADIKSDAVIATSKLAGAVTGITGHGLGSLATAAAVSGGTAGTITDDTITNADIKSDAAIATSKLSGAVTAIPGHGLGALASSAAVSGGTGGTITDLTITNADISETAAISQSKIFNLTTDLAAKGNIFNNGQPGTVSLGSNDSNNLQLKTNNMPRMTILASGTVGIGTISPSATNNLEVVGNSKFDGAIFKKVRVINSDVATIAPNDYFIVITGIATAATFTVPSCVTANTGQTMIFTNKGSAGTITIAGNFFASSFTIASTVTKEIICDGYHWHHF